MFTASAPPDLSRLSLHAALPISWRRLLRHERGPSVREPHAADQCHPHPGHAADSLGHDLCLRLHAAAPPPGDRKSTRLNSSHLGISYAVCCLKEKIVALLHLPPG